MHTIDSFMDSRTFGYKLQLLAERYTCEAISILSVGRSSGSHLVPFSELS